MDDPPQRPLWNAVVPAKANKNCNQRGRFPGERCERWRWNPAVTPKPTDPRLVATTAITDQRVTPRTGSRQAG